MFVYWRIGNAGSAQDILQYARVAKSLGHEVVMYAPPEPDSPFDCSLDLESADAVIFVFEWNLYLFPGEDKKKGGIYRDGLMGIGHLNVAKLFSRVPRQRRVILDCDGMYNDSIQLNGDFNHLDAEASRRRTELCDSISDKIFQPTYRPLRPNVRPFFFHAYDPSWERPLDFTHKSHGMIYVGNNWFRWAALHRLLRAIEPIRENLGRAALIGRDWAAMPWWVSSPLRERAYFTDPDYLKRLGIELLEFRPWALRHSIRCSPVRYSIIWGSSPAAPSRLPQPTRSRFSRRMRNMSERSTGREPRTWCFARVKRHQNRFSMCYAAQRCTRRPSERFAGTWLKSIRML
jgi:hypothetical protein